MRKNLKSVIQIILMLCLFIVSNPTLVTMAQDTPVTETSIPGLSEAVEISRDEYGIPTIHAENDLDLFMAYGYVMAQDRLWQMDGSRRLANGRLAEIAGAEQINWDYYHRTLGLYRTAEDSVPLIAPETLELLQAFTDGVNAYIATHIDSLPFEFLVMGYEPDEWTIADSITITRLVAVWLCGDAWEEEMYGKLITSLGEETAADLFRPVPSEEPDYTGHGGLPESVPQPDTLLAELEWDVSYVEENLTPINTEISRNYLVSSLLEPLAALSQTNLMEGSNIWAVDGSLSATGEPILAMDPHLNYFAPPIIYEVILDGGNFDCWGLTFPGMPFLPFGANQHITWGASNLPADCQDLYIERLNPENPDQYELDGEWVDFTVRTEAIPVYTPDESENVNLYNVYESVHGPVIRKRTNDYLAMRWTGLEPSDDVTSFMNGMKAETMEEFYESFRNFHSPPQNLCVAEKGPDGRVGQIIIGHVPIRTGYDGRSPVDGGDPSNDWTGFIPYDDLPHRLDPPEGFVVHANNMPLNGMDGNPLKLGGTLATSYRINRIIQLLLANQPLTFDDMRLIQMDDLDLEAPILVPELVDAWGRHSDNYPEEFEYYMMILSGWDYHLSMDSIAPTLYQLWLTEMGRILYVDNMAWTNRQYLQYIDRWVPLLEEYLNGESSVEWLMDNDQTVRDTKVLDAFTAAIDKLKREVGDDPVEWLWGDLNLATFPHPSGVATLIGGGNHRWGSGRYAIRVGHYALDSTLPSLNDFGAVFRSVIASENGEWVIANVLPPGEFGCTFGPHGTDQMQMWLNGEMRPVMYGAGENNGTCSIRLIP